MKKLALLSALLFFVGCVTWSPASGNAFYSSANLKQGKYKVVNNVSASATTMYILGSILPNPGQADLYRRVFEQLRQNAALEGTSRALANVTTDLVVHDYLVVKFVTLTVSADVVEFQ